VILALPELKYPRDKLFMVRIVGDSMSPYLEEGDPAVVYQDPGLAAKGKAVAVWFADDGVVTSAKPRTACSTWATITPYTPRSLRHPARKTWVWW